MPAARTHTQDLARRLAFCTSVHACAAGASLQASNPHAYARRTSTHACSTRVFDTRVRSLRGGTAESGGTSPSAANTATAAGGGGVSIATPTGGGKDNDGGSDGKSAAEVTAAARANEKASARAAAKSRAAARMPKSSVGRRRGRGRRLPGPAQTMPKRYSSSACSNHAVHTLAERTCTRACNPERCSESVPHFQSPN